MSWCVMASWKRPKKLADLTIICAEGIRNAHQSGRGVHNGNVS